VDLLGSVTHETVAHNKTGDRHILIKYSNGDICPYSKDRTISERYTVSFEVLCDQKADSLQNMKVDESDLCNPKFTVESKHGCPVF
jgi:hypothetical protein